MNRLKLNGSLTLLVLGLFVVSGMTCGPNPERNVLTPIQLARSTVTTALSAWNDWLGVQQRLVASMAEPEKSARIAEIQKAEKRVSAAVDEYNKMQGAADVAWKEYEALKALGTNAPPITLLELRAQQVTHASNALLEIIAVWIPDVKKGK